MHTQPTHALHTHICLSKSRNSSSSQQTQRHLSKLSTVCESAGQTLQPNVNSQGWANVLQSITLQFICTQQPGKPVRDYCGLDGLEERWGWGQRKRWAPGSERKTLRREEKIQAGLVYREGERCRCRRRGEGVSPTTTTQMDRSANRIKNPLRSSLDQFSKVIAS